MPFTIMSLLIINVKCLVHCKTCRSIPHQKMNVIDSSLKLDYFQILLLCLALSRPAYLPLEEATEIAFVLQNGSTDGWDPSGGRGT